MKILAIDTATPSCSVALMDDDVLLAEFSFGGGRTHARHLVPMVQTVLEGAAVVLSDIDALAVTRGPGSFTGLRIGLATAKGLAQGLDRPIVGVSTLEALAHQVGPTPHLIVAMIDARRSQVYCARYLQGNGRWHRQCTPAAVSPSAAVSGINQPVVLVGSGAVLYRDLLSDGLKANARFPSATNHVIRASTVGVLAWERLERGEVDTTESLVPLYLRKSDAELHPRLSPVS